MQLKVKKPDFWTLDQGITQSMINEFLECRRKAELSYKKGWTSLSTSNALTFGTHCHEVLDRCFKNMRNKVTPDYPVTINSYMEVYKEAAINERPWTEEDEKTHQMNKGFLHILIPKYFQKYGKKDSQKKWVFLEEEFRNGWSGGLTLRGKFDRVAEYSNKDVWIYDTKTKSRIDPNIQDRLSFDFQMMFYMLNAYLKTKIIPKGFVYDIIQRPNHRIKMNETLKQFMRRVDKAVDETSFYRIRISISEKEFMQWVEKQFHHIIGEFHAWAVGTLPTYKNTSSCENRYGSCKFIKVCGLRDFTGLYKRKKVFAELGPIPLTPA